MLNVDWLSIHLIEAASEGGRDIGLPAKRSLTVSHRGTVRRGCRVAVNLTIPESVTIAMSPEQVWNPGPEEFYDRETPPWEVRFVIGRDGEVGGRYQAR